MIRTGKIDIEREFARSARTVVITHHNVGAATGNIFVDRLTDLGLERGEIAGKIHDDVALLPIHRINLDTELRAVVIGLAAAVSGHRSHLDFSFRPNAAAA